MAQTKQQKELIALGGLLVVAVAIWYFYFGSKRSQGTENSLNVPYVQINAQDFGKIITGLEKTQSTEYKSAGRNIFMMGAIPPENGGLRAAAGQGPVKPAFRVFNQPQPIAPPPPAELPSGWVFYGYGNAPVGTSRQAFLKGPGQDDPPVIVSEGDLVLNHIKILHIGNERIEFEDINTQQKGSKGLEAMPQS